MIDNSGRKDLAPVVDGCDSHFERLDRVITREIVGETILVPIRGAVSDAHHIFTLNPVAAHVWGALDGATRVSLVTSVCDAFDVQRERAEEEISAFLRQLVEAGLAREVSSR